MKATHLWITTRSLPFRCYNRTFISISSLPKPSNFDKIVLFVYSLRFNETAYSRYPKLFNFQNHLISVEQKQSNCRRRDIIRARGDNHHVSKAPADRSESGLAIGREFGASAIGMPAVRRDTMRCGTVRYGAVRRVASRRDGVRRQVPKMRVVSSAQNRDAIVCRRTRQPAPHWPPPHITLPEHVRGLPRLTRGAADAGENEPWPAREWLTTRRRSRRRHRRRRVCEKHADYGAHMCARTRETACTYIRNTRIVSDIIIT